MQLHDLDHLAGAASALVNATHITFSSTAALMRVVKHPSDALKSRMLQCDQAEILVYENHDPVGCVSLLNETLGAGSSFHEKYGYCLKATVSWEAFLPDDWVDRLEYVNQQLRRSTYVLAISPADVALAALAQDNPDALIAMDLMMGSVISTSRLLSLLDGWTGLNATLRNSIRLRILSISKTIGQLTQAPLPNLPQEQTAPVPSGNVIALISRALTRVRHG